GGIRLGSLVTGMTYPAGRESGSHRELTLEGWIPAASAEKTTRDGFDLVITAGAGERLLAEPGGATIARLVTGTLLTRLGARGNWVQVRRIGWVSQSAIGPADGTEVASALHSGVKSGSSTAPAASAPAAPSPAPASVPGPVADAAPSPAPP